MCHLTCDSADSRVCTDVRSTSLSVGATPIVPECAVNGTEIQCSLVIGDRRSMRGDARGRIVV